MAAIRPAMATKTSAEWLHILEKHDILAAKVNDFGDVFADPQVQAVNQIAWVEQAGIGQIPVPQIPGQAKIDPDGALAQTPGLGQHTDKILAELGYRKERIAALRGSEAVR